MKMRSLLTKALVLSVLAAFAFTTGFAQTKPIKYIGNADTLINVNKTWDCDTIYFLKGKVYVTNGAELTIQPGTVIVGDTLNKGSLIITKGSKIHAVGTATCPIVFTSSKAPGKRNRGDWGGVIILGKSTINQPGGVANIEGIAPGALSQYGGGLTPDIHDNSGELNFVRIEFAGVALSLNNEINGLTMGGVGDGTLIDYVQVSYANDDSFEWFGGTVNCKHLIAFRGLDDDFDTDNGFSGKIQFGIGLRDPLVADVSGSNGFESDNDAGGSLNTPQTRAVFSNMTVLAGSDSATNNLFRNGAQIRRNSHMLLYNSIVMGYPTGILIDGTTTQANVLADVMVEHNIIAAKYAPKYISSVPAGTDATNVINLLTTGADNRFYSGNASVLLSNPYNLNNPNLRPATGSPALSGANFSETALTDPFFTPTAYVGALPKQAAQNWAQVWVNFKPTNTNYSGLCACSTSAAANAVAEDEAVAATTGEVSIYPNPARGTFNVNVGGYTGNVTVKVTNMNGAVVYNKQASVTAKSVVNVTLKNAPAGLYFVTITNGAQSTTKKINILQ